MSFRFSLRHNRRYLTYALMSLLLMSLLPASLHAARGANSGVQDADNLAWKLKLVLDGRTFKSGGNGFFLGASLFDNVTTDMTIYKDEIFGPVLVVLRVKTLEALNTVRKVSLALKALVEKEKSIGSDPAKQKQFKKLVGDWFLSMHPLTFGMQGYKLVSAIMSQK